MQNRTNLPDTLAEEYSGLLMIQDHSQLEIYLKHCVV